MTVQQTPIYNFPYYQGADPAAGDAQQQALAQRVEAVLQPIDTRVQLPVGAMMMWPVATISDPNWLICNGNPYAISAYPQLGALLGENPAGSGNFKVPDLRARMPIAAGPSFSSPPYAGGTYDPGDTGGAERVSLNTGNLPQHNHPVSDPTHNHPISASSAAASPVPSTRNIFMGDSTIDLKSVQQGTAGTVLANMVHSVGNIVGYDNGSHTHTITATESKVATGVTVGNTGSAVGDAALAHDNMPPFFCVLFIIKAKA